MANERAELLHLEYPITGDLSMLAGSGGNRPHSDDLDGGG